MSLLRMFNPKSVAVIGASRDAKSVGYGILKNLALGCVLRCRYCSPFLGRVYPVNPFADEILGIKCHEKVTDIAEAIDLAIIATPAAVVESQIDYASRKM